MLFKTCSRENDKRVSEYTQKSPKWAGRFGEPLSEGETCTGAFQERLHVECGYLLLSLFLTM